jgi:hypothetical protein
MWGLLLHIQENMDLHISPSFICVQEMFAKVQIIFASETCSSGFELGNTPRHLLASTTSAAMPQASKRDESCYSERSLITSGSHVINSATAVVSGLW